MLSQNPITGLIVCSTNWEIDGGWQEGGSYWNYGVHTSSFFADALKRLTNKKINLFENKRLASNPVTLSSCTFLSSGNKSLNFEDSGGNGLVGSPHLINKLATETQNPHAAWYRNFLNKEASDVFDIIWPDPNLLHYNQASLLFISKPLIGG